MADPAAPASAAPPSPAPAPSPSPAARPGSLTGTNYEPISDQAFDRLAPQEQSRYARVRDEANNPRWQPRSDLAPSPAPKPAAARPGEPPAPAAPPASVVDGKLRIGEGETAYELSADDVKMLMAQKAEADLRATRVPSDASGYKPELPADLRLPDGVQVKIDTADPAYRDLAAFAHARGWDICQPGGASGRGFC